MKRKISLLLALLTLLASPALALEACPWIDIAENAVLPGESAMGDYPATLTRGALAYDAQALLTAALGENYVAEERNEYSCSSTYYDQMEGEPWEKLVVTIDDDTQSFWYYNPMIAGERGAEYQPSALNMMPDESLVLCRALLMDYFDEGYMAHPSKVKAVRDRWSYADRWMTDSEYAASVKQSKLHYSVFDHKSSEGLTILDDHLFASVGVNGLSHFEINWHDFVESTQRLAPMPLQEAVDMANGTRSAKTTLLYADIVYSNRVSQTDDFNLCWYLVTSKGVYLVDNVLSAHVCDSYEY